MMTRGSRLESVARCARRAREDSAPRLREEVPTLLRLKIDIEERAGATAVVRHARHVVVDRAPALFLVPCGDRGCKGSGHDLTERVMCALRSGDTSFGGEDACAGVPPDGCPRVLRFEAVATYAPTSTRAAPDVSPRSGTRSSRRPPGSSLVLAVHTPTLRPASSV
jgi:hypothetical protein